MHPFGAVYGIQKFGTVKYGSFRLYALVSEYIIRARRRGRR